MPPRCPLEAGCRPGASWVPPLATTFHSCVQDATVIRAISRIMGFYAQGKRTVSPLGGISNLAQDANDGLYTDTVFQNAIARKYAPIRFPDISTSVSNETQMLKGAPTNESNSLIAQLIRTSGGARLTTGDYRQQNGGRDIENQRPTTRHAVHCNAGGTGTAGIGLGFIKSRLEGGHFSFET